VFIGRHAELARLNETLAAGKACLIVGTAGIGKTALMRTAATARGVRVYEGGGLATLSSLAYLPIMRAVGRELPDQGAAAIAAAVRRHAGRGVLLIDDLQWADDGTLHVLELLIGKVPLLLAVRRGDPAAEGVRARLGEASVPELVVSKLADDDAAAIVRDQCPDLAREAVAAAVHGAHGVPLLLRRLTVAGEPDPALRLTFAAWLLPCLPAMREAAARLALLGRPSPPELAGAGIAELVETGMAVRCGPDVELAHALIGETVLEHVGADRQRALHAELARRLPDPGEAARHHAAAGEPNRAVALALRAAEETSHPGERAAHLGLAAGLVDGREGDPLRLRAALALGDAGAHDGALELADAVARDGPLAARACLAASRALFSLGRVAAAEARLNLGISQSAPDDQQAIELRFELARRAGWEWDGERATAIGREILTLARNPRAEALGRYALGVGAFCAEDPACVEHFAASGTLAAAAEDAILEMDALVAAAQSAMEFSPAVEALAAVDTTGERARELGDATREAECRWLRHHVEAFRLGRFRVAADGCRRLLEVPVPVGAYADRVRGVLGYALAAMGDDEGAVDVLDEGAMVASTSDGHQWIAWARAEAEWLAGRPRGALGASSHADGRSPTMLVALSVADGWAAVELGKPPPALADSIGSPTGRGLREQLVALHARAAGDAERAEASFAAAAEQLGPYHVADAIRCRWAAGRAALERGDVAGARAHLLAAEFAVKPCGIVPLERRIGASLRAAGVHRAAARGVAGSLSRREREVLDLVGRGLTTREIAGRLGIAGSTVETMVRSAMRRLGARTRQQAALMAAAEGTP
jgi:DNA-binding CsgD family transcriptional regulator